MGSLPRWYSSAGSPHTHTSALPPTEGHRCNMMNCVPTLPSCIQCGCGRNTSVGSVHAAIPASTAAVTLPPHAPSAAHSWRPAADTGPECSPLLHRCLLLAFDAQQLSVTEPCAKPMPGASRITLPWAISRISHHPAVVQAAWTQASRTERPYYQWQPEGGPCGGSSNM